MGKETNTSKTLTWGVKSLGLPQQPLSASAENNFKGSLEWIFISEPAQSSGHKFFESMGSTDSSTFEDLIGCQLVFRLVLGRVWKDRSVGKMTKNHIVCCVLSFLIEIWGAGHGSRPV
jgi:hypothetical protein